MKRGVKTPMEIVPTGVDLARFSKGDRMSFRRRYEIPSDALVIGHAGRLAPEKNLNFLVNCMVEALKKNDRIHALIVGKGPAEKIIQDSFSGAGLEKRLHLSGVLHYQDMVDAYYAMDLFAFASLSETQGIVLIEAMAAGVPVVALAAPGAREVVKDYHNGRLLEKMDSQSFVDALIWTLNRTPEELKTIKQVIRMTAQKYSIDISASRMLKIYEDTRSRKTISAGKKNSSRYVFLWGLRAEWDIYGNYVKSVLTSIFKGGFNKTESPDLSDTTGEIVKTEAGDSVPEIKPDLHVMTEDGKRIAFTHIKNGFDNVVIIAHGFYNNKDTFLFKKMAVAFGKEYDVIMFDFRGHGKSSDVFTWTALEHKDLRSIIAYAKENKYSKIGVIGFSLGAAIALVEASSQKTIDSVIAVSSPADLGKINFHFWEKDMWRDLMLNMGIKGRGKGVRPGSLSLQKIQPIDIVSKISPTPVLFIHGEKDWIIKPSHSQRLFDAALEPKSIMIIKDGGHAERIFDVYPEQFMKICLDRFSATLIEERQ
ncbi:MAG: alpha/beta fold hydrolase [Candidatus Omnitrophica bacterium]|nr:alpha/beta fold hydrolase [Candidatus Omnitrophota bacterium]